MSRPSLIDLTVPKVPTRPLCVLHDMAVARCLICQETRKRFEARPVDPVVAPVMEVQPVATCAWSEHPDDGYWQGACGAAWTFNYETPRENQMHFCPNCGKAVVLSAQEKAE